MSELRVIATEDGAVGVITLNHPKANSYDIQFMEELDQAIETMNGNDAVKVVILRSGLEKFFSAGAATKANMKMIRVAHQALRKMGNSPKIFIAAIGGHALGGGLEMALACDLRFAADADFRIGLPEVTLGLLPGNGGTQRLPRLVGRTRALDLMITGEPVHPRRAHELGIVDRLFPESSFVDDTMKYARRVASGATLAIAKIKQAVYEGLELPLTDALKLERELIEPLFDSDDAKEGFAAFAEKRQPVYTGR
jgi:enoyl-CoA hydratase/carnithine racemase